MGYNTYIKCHEWALGRAGGLGVMTESRVRLRVTTGVVLIVCTAVLRILLDMGLPRLPRHRVPLAAPMDQSSDYPQSATL